MEKSNFDRLLQRYLTGQLSGSEKAKIDAWLEAMTAGNLRDMSLGKADEERLFQKIVAGKDNTREIRAFIPEKQKPALSRWILRIAATLLIIAFVAYAGWRTGTTGEDRLSKSSSGPVEQLKLADGSLVWLKSNSTLHYYLNLDENVRYATLKGEALFEVAPDADVPFVVQCGPVMLKVVGTSFNVRAHADSLELRVLTGKVNVSLETNSHSVDAGPNEKVVYAARAGIKKFSLTAAESAAVTLGTTYNMQFTHAPLEEVLRRLQEKFGVRIVIAAGKAGDCRITATLTDQSLEHSLTVITEVLNVAYQRKGNTIVVTGEGCQ